MSQPLELCADHVVDAFGVLSTALSRRADCTDGDFVEIGPGDNVGVAFCWLASGAKSVQLIDRYSSWRWDETQRQLCVLLAKRLGLADDAAKTLVDHVVPMALNWKREPFEHATVRSPNLIYSHDVLPHLKNPAVVFRKAFNELKAGGWFLNRVRFCGTGDFESLADPFAYRRVPELLWQFMYSNRPGYHNRLSASDFAGLAKRIGFQEAQVDAIAYVESAEEHSRSTGSGFQANQLLDAILAFRK